MSRTMLWSALTAWGAVMALGSPVALGAGSMEPGLDAYERFEYRDAMVEFPHAAEAGDARAQEILAFMYLYGSTLYGADVPRARSKAIRWFARAAASGRPVSQHLPCVLARGSGERSAKEQGC